MSCGIPQLQICDKLRWTYVASANVLRPTASASLLLGIAITLFLHCTAKLRGQVRKSCGIPQLQICVTRSELMLRHTAGANVLRPTESASVLLGITVAIFLYCSAKLREHVQKSCGIPQLQICDKSPRTYVDAHRQCKCFAAYRKCKFVAWHRSCNSLTLHSKVAGARAKELRHTAAANLRKDIANITVVAEDRIGTIVDAMHRFNTAAARVGQRRKRRLMSTSSSTAEAHAPGCTPGELPCHGPSLCRSRRSTHGAGLRRRI